MKLSDIKTQAEIKRMFSAAKEPAKESEESDDATVLESWDHQQEYYLRALTLLDRTNTVLDTLRIHMAEGEPTQYMKKLVGKIHLDIQKFLDDELQAAGTEAVEVTLEDNKLIVAPRRGPAMREGEVG